MVFPFPLFVEVRDIDRHPQRETERERKNLEGSFVHTWNVEKWVQVIEEDLKLDCKDAGGCEIMGMYMSMALKHISRYVFSPSLMLFLRGSCRTINESLSLSLSLSLYLCLELFVCLSHFSISLSLMMIYLIISEFVTIFVEIFLANLYLILGFLLFFIESLRSICTRKKEREKERRRESVRMAEIILLQFGSGR
jgi:hypothetical protein